MIRVLRIFNLILVESAEVSFDRGFNVLSGETGSGKSAIMAALSLVLGYRSDASLIRNGKEKAAIEAVFDFPLEPSFSELLKKSGIDFDADEEILIRREIAASGKSRAFVNNQMATVSLLRKIGGCLVKFLGQHASQKLQTLDFHRYSLDHFGNIETELFSKSYKELQNLSKKLKEHQSSESERLREIDAIKRQRGEIEDVDPKPSEDEDLFREYERLSASEEFQEICGTLFAALQGEEGALSRLSVLNRQFERAAQIDPRLNEALGLFNQSLIELGEVCHALEKARSQNEFNPQRLKTASERLSRIHQLKKKYGATLEEVEAYRTSLKGRLEELEAAECSIEKVQKEIDFKKAECDRMAASLTQSRRQAAKKMEKAMQKELQSLNMPEVSFRIRIDKQNRTESGGDSVCFYFRPNIGENEISVAECASGGELSRIMLALQVLLAGKEKIPTIVFDEIDAGIGGRTAQAVGKKLQEIGKRHQVLCITHFPQVAKLASHHLQISKEEIGGRTLTVIDALGDAARSEELERMKGETVTS